jgi:lipoate-protein ligase A
MGDPALAPIEVRVERAQTTESALAADEALLRAGRPLARVAVISDLAVSVGAGVSADRPYLGRLRADRVPILRRASGGSAVLHAPGDLAWSIALPRSDPRVGRDFVRAYGRFGAPVIRALEGFGLATTWAPPLGLAEEYCLLSRRGSVLAAGGRVLGGAAQHATGTGLLHHGVVARAVDAPRLRDLFQLDPDAVARLTGWSESKPDLDSETLAVAVGDALAAGVPVP